MPARKIYCKSCGKRAFKFSQNSRQSWGKIPTIREVYKCSTCQEKTVFLLIEESGHDKRETMLMEEIDKLRANVARQRELLRVKREERDKGRLLRQIDALKRALRNLEDYISRL